MSGARTASDPDRLRPEDLGFGRLLDATSDAIVVVDDTGHILLWNGAATRIFGYEPQEALGMNVDALVPPEFRERHHAGISRYRDTGRGALIDSGKPYEVPGIRKDGGRVWIDLTLSPLQHHGRHYALGIIRDVTERVQLRERTDSDRKQLQDAYDSLEAFTYVVSHDLKEPVRGLGVYLHELEHDPDAPDRRELIRGAVRSHANLQRLLDGLLEWSRTAMTPLEPTLLRLSEVLADPGCAAQWETLRRERRASVAIASDIAPVMGTEPLVCRVFGNLITNAIRHNPDPDPRVEISEAPPMLPGHVHIIVRDNGPGFPQHLVTRLRSLKNKPSTIKGGFGLAITRRAVERLHGTIALDNDPQGGGVVHLQLPAAAEPRAGSGDRRAGGRR